MPQVQVDADVLARCMTAKLREAGVSEASTQATARALMHASLCGVDSHGVRLVPHYCSVASGGRINATPEVTVRRTGPATAIVDGDDGLGHLTAYRAAETAVEIAREAGIGAVGAIRSSHFGAAGAYALAIAEAGMIGFATTNSDSLVGLFNGQKPFHGTNPLAFAAPVEGERPWLFDMATSSIPYNRILLYRSLGRPLPPNVAADGDGVPTIVADDAEMLMPVGGENFGFKGAALAGVATLFSAILMGTALDHAMLPMNGKDVSTPRNMGHFFIAVDPQRFAGADIFAAGMRSYLSALRSAPAVEGGKVMAPGDREWAVSRQRQRDGIPLDPDTAAFFGLTSEG